MLRIGFLGAGGVAGVHCKAVGLVEGAIISAVYDVRPDQSARIGEVTGATACTSVNEVLDACDAVYILTPPHTHRELCLRSLEAGKHVLCEKPLAITLDDGKAIQDAARRSNAKFMIAFSMRYRESNQRLKSIYDSGSLGSPITFWFQRMFGGSGYDPDNWRYREESQSGMSIESLSHQIDTIRWIFGEIDTVYARVVASHSALPEVDNNIHTIFTLRNGATATLHVSWSSHLAFNTTGINGTKGTARIWGSGGADHDTLYVASETGSGEEVTRLDEKYDEKIMANECRGFLDLIDGAPASGGVAGPTVEDGLRALEVSHAMLLSSRENRVVELERK